MSEEDDAEEALKAYEAMPHYLRLRQPMGESWKPPPLTPEQQAERDAYIKKWNCPF